MQRQIGHLVKAGSALGRPAPHLPFAVGGLTEIGQRRGQQLQIHAVYGGTRMRLAKFLATAGVASRRAAEEMIRADRVVV
ncbi:MAG TPA: S4 domain-containing protein, partial [Baekduia sp.]